MSDLSEWLTKILDEDEKAAKRAGGGITEMQNDNYGLLLVPHGWVLDDIAAKRAILALHSGEYEEMCQSWEGNYMYEPCPTLRLLASAYADRPGYRKEWHPDTPSSTS